MTIVVVYHTTVVYQVSTWLALAFAPFAHLRRFVIAHCLAGKCAGCRRLHQMEELFERGWMRYGQRCDEI